MEIGSAFLIFIGVMLLCFMVYVSIPSKYAKLEESFGGFINRSLVRFENEKSPLHTIVYGGTRRGKTYFVRQNLKLYHDQDQNQNQYIKNIIIVCKDGSDWIYPETGEFYTGFNTCDINMIISKNMPKLRDSVIVLDDMDDKLNKDIAYYFTEGRHHNIQMVVMCNKPAQIIDKARMSCDTIYITS